MIGKDDRTSGPAEIADTEERAKSVAEVADKEDIIIWMYSHNNGYRGQSVDVVADREM